MKIFRFWYNGQYINVHSTNLSDARRKFANIMMNFGIYVDVVLYEPAIVRLTIKKRK